MITRQTRSGFSDRRGNVANFACRFACQGWTQAAVCRVRQGLLAVAEFARIQACRVGRVFTRRTGLAGGGGPRKDSTYPTHFLNSGESSYGEIRIERLPKIDRMTSFAQHGDVV